MSRNYTGKTNKDGNTYWCLCFYLDARTTTIFINAFFMKGWHGRAKQWLWDDKRICVIRKHVNREYNPDIRKDEGAMMMKRQQEVAVII